MNVDSAPRRKRCADALSPVAARAGDHAVSKRPVQLPVLVYVCRARAQRLAQARGHPRAGVRIIDNPGKPFSRCRAPSESGAAATCSNNIRALRQRHVNLRPRRSRSNLGLRLASTRTTANSQDIHAIDARGHRNEGEGRPGALCAGLRRGRVYSPRMGGGRPADR